MKTHHSATQSTQHYPSVTLLGLGPMGSALAHTLIDAGVRLTVWNRTAAKADPLINKGAHYSVNVHDVLTASEVIISCLSDYTALYSVLSETKDNSLSTQTVINLSSGTVSEAEAMAEYFAARNIRYLDGIIMAPPSVIGTKEAALFFSGESTIFQNISKLLFVLGGEIRHLGTDPRTAALYNMALTSFLYAAGNGYLHAAALLSTAGVQPSEFSKIALDWFLPNMLHPVLTDYSQQMHKGEYPGDEGTLTSSLAPIEHLIETSKAAGIDAILPEQMKLLIQQGIAAGYGDHHYVALFEMLKTGNTTKA